MPDDKPSEARYSNAKLAAVIGKSTIFGVVSSAAQIGTRLITVPTVIHHLGIGGYGIWSIIVVTAAYMRFGSAGIKSAFQKYVAEATGNGDFGDANNLLSTGSFSMLALSLVSLVPVTIFSKQLAVISGVPPEFLVSAADSFSALASIYAVCNFGAVFEAIVMGGHRVDLIRKYSTVLTISEAIVILALLHFGYGLLAMTLVMGGSELIYILCCYVASKRIVPQIRISLDHFTIAAFPELIRFAGSYQLVSVLELLYGAVVPILVLKYFGSGAAGILALASRVVGSFLLVPDALIHPLLSGGTMILASGSEERLRLFLIKAFKVTLGAALPPLAFASFFGTTMIVAWTDEADPRLRTAISLCALASLFRAISLLQLVLYRASGRALLDNIRQILRLLAILLVGYFGRNAGFNGVLAGAGAAELLGVIFMFFAMAATFKAFSGKMLARDALRIVAATAIVICAGLIAGIAPVPVGLGNRVTALVKLSEITLGSMLAVWPALILTGCMSEGERRTLIDSFTFKRSAALAVSE